MLGDLLGVLDDHVTFVGGVLFATPAWATSFYVLYKLELLRDALGEERPPSLWKALVGLLRRLLRLFRRRRPEPEAGPEPEPAAEDEPAPDPDAVTAPQVAVRAQTFRLGDEELTFTFRHHESPRSPS
ncbi:hypothetical protein [Blastococcus xanthinilyticus]|uniref:Uncharacterized protein n=1 Tax=Blastococcus xanthinilyticus TaxID=1564164 RepID=A0A5S5CNQ0_9ACTN|nr:hypothetical protein [Blastococcus xanthinilyticus]TYP82051.1 hypothetical protein BD833_12035 [Blastococcus xanthinilyticus]